MKSSATGLFPGFYSEAQVASGVRYVAHIDPQLLADGTYFVLESEGEMVACGGWSRRARPYAGSGDSGDDDRVLRSGHRASQHPGDVRAAGLDSARPWPTDHRCQ